MARQHTPPVLIDSLGRSELLLPLQLESNGAYDEAFLQRLIFENPRLLPVAEIDPSFEGLVPICTELNTKSGPIDLFLINRLGLPTLVETKLWRNIEARRKVIGQILDYAKEIGRWSYTDLQRAVSQRLKLPGNTLFDRLRAEHPDLDEATFVDDVTKNLRNGRFLLLIVGDGIREDVVHITEYLQRHSGLHFVFGLVELPLFQLSDGRRLACPRIVATTTIVGRTIIEVRDGVVTVDADDQSMNEDSAELDSTTKDRLAFWTEFLGGLALSDPSQPIPRAPKQGYISFILPAPGNNCWLSVYRDMANNEVGVFLSCTRNTIGEEAVHKVVADWDNVSLDLGGTVRLVNRDAKPRIIDSARLGALNVPETRSKAIAWLQARTNDFVNALRPRIADAVSELQGD